MSESKTALTNRAKRIMINLLTEFARLGYSLTSSFRTSAKDSGKDTLIFLRDKPDPDPIFFAVAFHSHDRIWIIDAEADVGEALEKGIKDWWTNGIKDVRTRERHCRELRLQGNPCKLLLSLHAPAAVLPMGSTGRDKLTKKGTAHSTSALISARCIHLVIMKVITHYERIIDPEFCKTFRGIGGTDHSYNYVASVNMADAEESEMAVSFYRKARAGPRI